MGGFFVVFFLQDPPHQWAFNARQKPFFFGVEREWKLLPPTGSKRPYCEQSEKGTSLGQQASRGQWGSLGGAMHQRLKGVWSSGGDLRGHSFQP